MRPKQLITLLFLVGTASGAFAQDSIMWSSYLRSSTTAYGSYGCSNGIITGKAFAPDSTGHFQDNHSVSYDSSFFEDYGVAHINLENGNIDTSFCLGGLHNEYTQSIFKTKDGGTLITGESDSHDMFVPVNHGGADMWVVKLDTAHNVQWARSYGGYGGDDALRVLTETSDGGFVITGMCGGGGGDVTNFQGGFNDGWIIRLDAQGNLVWQKTVGGSFYDLFYGGMQTSDGDFIFCGYTNSIDGDLDTVSLHGGFDALVVKTDSSGNTVWVKTFGGFVTDVFRSVIETDSAYIFVGYSASDSDQVADNFGMTDGLLLVTDKQGNFLSSKNFGGSGADDVYCILKPDSFILLGLLTNSTDSNVVGNHGGYDVWLVQLDSLYDIRFSKCFGGDMNEYGFALSMCLLDTPRRDILVCSSTQSSNSGDIDEENTVGSMWIFRVKNLDTTLFIPDTTVIIDTTFTEMLTTNTYGIIVFPNPVDEVFVVESKGKKPLGEVILYNQLGSVVIKQKTKDSFLTVGTQRLAAGMYFCKIIPEKESVVLPVVIVH